MQSEDLLVQLFQKQQTRHLIDTGKMRRQAFQRASVARFKALDHALSGRRCDLNRELQVRAASSFMQFQSVKGYSDVLTACFETFAGYHAPARRNNVVDGFAPEL